MQHLLRCSMFEIAASSRARGIATLVADARRVDREARHVVVAGAEQRLPARPSPSSVSRRRRSARRGREWDALLAAQAYEEFAVELRPLGRRRGVRASSMAESGGFPFRPVMTAPPRATAVTLAGSPTGRVRATTAPRTHALRSTTCSGPHGLLLARPVGQM